MLTPTQYRIKKTNSKKRYIMNKTAWIILGISVLAIVVTILVMKKKNGATPNGNGTTASNGTTEDDTLADNTGGDNGTGATQEDEADLGMS